MLNFFNLTLYIFYFFKNHINIWIHKLVCLYVNFCEPNMYFKKIIYFTDQTYSTRIYTHP